MGGTRKLLRGHYNPTNWSRKYPNLQKHRLDGGKRVLICTKCLKKLAKPTKYATMFGKIPAAAGVNKQ